MIKLDGAMSEAIGDTCEKVFESLPRQMLGVAGWVSGSVDGWKGWWLDGGLDALMWMDTWLGGCMYG